MTTNDFEADNGTTRDELLQRVALMETMIAAGRRSTGRYGWIFVMWGLTYFAAIGWIIFLPFKNWAWPVCVATSIVLGGVIRARQKRTDGESGSQRSRGIEAVWKGMGLAVTLYVIAAVSSGHVQDPAYVAAILFFIGLAHAISAMILRWGVQGAVAAMWFAGGIATFFVPDPKQEIVIFLVASFFGMILFGLYAMWLERKRSAALVQNHA